MNPRSTSHPAGERRSWLSRRLRAFTFAQKMMFTTVATMIPMVGIILFLITTSVNKDIEFGRSERLGLEYQRPLERLLQLIPEHALLVRRGAAAEAETVAHAVDAAFDELEKVDARVGPALQFTPAGLAQRKREHVQLANVRNEWRQLTTDRALAAAGERHVHLVGDVRTMIAHAGDTSNLILDPDLDSYYLMDVTLVALPQNQDRVATIAAYAREALLAGPLTAKGKTQFAVYAALLREGDLDRIRGDAQTALLEDVNFNGLSPTLQARLPGALESYFAAQDAFAALIDAAAADTGPAPTADAFAAAAARARAESFKLWGLATDELDVLLATRVDGYVRSRTFSIGLVLATLLVLCVLLALIVRNTDRALTALSARLESTVTGVRDSLHELGASSHQLADRAGSQAASLEETSASLEEIASITKVSADNGAEAKRVAADTSSSAETAGRDMADMQLAMDAIKTSSDGISKIIKTIDEIAFQTNILALNAAVEAARAGEAGMGFAVVAEEVRGLAQRCAAAARETSDKIEDSIGKSRRGAELSAKVDASLKEILRHARKMDTIIADIARSADEQRKGVAQLNAGVGELDKITQANAATAGEAAHSVELLGGRGDELVDIAAVLWRMVRHGNEPVESPAALAADEVEDIPAAPPVRRAAKPAPAESFH